MQRQGISAELFEWLNGENLKDKKHEVMLLMTVMEDGCPHNAMISAGEVAAIDRNTSKDCIIAGTTTTENAKRSKKTVLVAVYKGKVHYVRLA
jgi:hypothetical protein